MSAALAAVRARAETEGTVTPHVPVMREEVTRLVLGGDARLVVDATVGAAGHASFMLDTSPSVRVIGVDRDPQALAIAEERLRSYGDRSRLVRASYDEFAIYLGDASVADAYLLDLGISSMQIDRAERGFSHGNTGPLDMRMSGDGRSARDFLHASGADALADVLRRYGEVRRAGRIAREVSRAAAEGNLESTADLASAVMRAHPGAPVAELSRVFQAIRIAVNDELGRLKRFFAGVTERVAPGGRVVVVCYHSLEDRAVKTWMRDMCRGCVCPPALPVCGCGRTPLFRPVTRKALRPADIEVRENPRSRSARVRAVERVGEDESA